MERHLNGPIVAAERVCSSHVGRRKEVALCRDGPCVDDAGCRYARCALGYTAVASAYAPSN
eukprot:9918956-Lingulodinium_polyedra.AAC.1